MRVEDEDTLSAAGDILLACRDAFSATTYGTQSRALADAAWGRASDEYNRIRVIVDGPNGERIDRT